MNKSVLTMISAGLLLLPACGGSGSSATSEGLTSLGETGIDSGNDTNNESADSNNSGDGDGDSNTGDGDGDPGDGDGDPPTTTSGDGDGDNDTGPDQKFDTLVVPDAAYNCGAGGGGDDPEFSYLWAANSTQGTISKIDTKTVTEVGRYIVRPDSAGSPSRTSVSLSGHVAVANRNGGVTKVYAQEEFCQDTNGTPGIQTSNSSAYLPWGEEECIAWHKPMAYQSQRPVAWGQGEFNEGTCLWENEELWTAGTNNNGTIDIYVLDGEDGSTKEMIAVPTGGNGLTASYYGIYGGAVDGNGDFWGSQLGSSGRLIRVNRQDMSYDIWDTPNEGSWYGMTVDEDGMVWLCRNYVARFDPMTETWTTAQTGGYTGCMADVGEDGLLWQAASGINGVIGVNRDTLQVEKMWPAGGAYGISIDFEGYVWAVAFGSTVSKIDPDSGQYWTYNGLVGAYTYSDMTGFALSSVGTPSG
jgi:hypothetical protein